MPLFIALVVFYPDRFPQIESNAGVTGITGIYAFYLASNSIHSSYFPCRWVTARAIWRNRTVS